MPIRDDSAGSYGTWNDDDLSWIDWLKASASDGGNALSNLGRNIVQGFSPIGTSEQGNMSLQVPPIVSGIADSYARLAGTPSQPGNAYNLTGVPELDAPIQQDMSNVLLSLYGGNAVSGLAKSRSVPTSGRISNVPAAQLAHEEFGWPALEEYGRRRPGGVGGFESYQSYLPPPSISARDFRKQTLVDFNPKLANENDFADVGYLKALEGQKRDRSGLEVIDGDLLSDTGKPSTRGNAISTTGDQTLAMDYASRMARAKDMGFDVEMPWYHGTNSEFSQFKPSENGYIGPGVYMSGDSGRAAEYGPHVGEYRVRGDLIDEYEVSRLGNELYAAGVKNPHNQALEEMRRRGYSGVINGQDVTVWDPSNIRSVNAAFDPARAGENGLFLSDNRPSLLGSALATGGETPLGVTDYAKAAYKHLRYPDEAVSPELISEWASLAKIQQDTRNSRHYTKANDHLLDKSAEWLRSETNPYNDGAPGTVGLANGPVDPYDAAYFNSSIRKRKIDDGTLYSSGASIPQYQDEDLPPWLRF